MKAKRPREQRAPHPEAPRRKAGSDSSGPGRGGRRGGRRVPRGPGGRRRRGSRGPARGPCGFRGVVHPRPSPAACPLSPTGAPAGWGGCPSRADFAGARPRNRKPSSPTPPSPPTYPRSADRASSAPERTIKGLGARLSSEALHMQITHEALATLSGRAAVMLCIRP